MVDTRLAEGRLTDKRRLDEMTWPEIRAAIDVGRDLVIAAAGSMEQHGPHLPLQTDTLLGTFLAEAVVERIDGAFQGPTIPFGVSTHHMAFAGTITLDTETFKAVVRHYVQSLASHGFKTVVIIPSHGGNFAPLGELEKETGGQIGGARYIAYSDLHGYLAAKRPVMEAGGISVEVGGAHAGETETSMVMAAREELVQADHLAEGFVEEFTPEIGQKVFAEGMTALTNNGILGDARPANRERGFAYRDAAADFLAAWIQERIPS